MSTQPPVGRPRDHRTHTAILDAAEQLVVDTGYTATSVTAIAARAGVGKDAIYRRWSGKPELIYEALFTRVDMGPVPDQGTVEADVTALVAALIAELSAPAAAAALPGLLADFAADPKLRAVLRDSFLAPAKLRMIEIFERARARGEVGEDVAVELVLDTVAGAVFFHVGVLGEPVTAELAAQLARIITAGIGPR
ncbi:TetR/AcrR family transcriptional regulator [Nocardia sp. NPDC127606]|uniref:TetR/AcrR family transcriptional regulator n=1 Tax=Nocardia sp. NPDC127606 TaxID=3345406 RepID=UPI0036294587